MTLSAERAYVPLTVAYRMRYDGRVDTSIPSVDDLRESLRRLSHAETRKLAQDSGVPFTTLWKLRTGETRNPGIETVRTFLPHIQKPVGCNG